MVFNAMRGGWGAIVADSLGSGKTSNSATRLLCRRIGLQGAQIVMRLTRLLRTKVLPRYQQRRIDRYRNCEGGVER